MECVVTRIVTLWGDAVYWRSVGCFLILIRGTAQHPQKSCCRTRPLCCQQWEDSRRPTSSHPVSLRQCANVRLTAVGPGPSMTGLGRLPPHGRRSPANSPFRPVAVLRDCRQSVSQKNGNCPIHGSKWEKLSTAALPLTFQDKWRDFLPR
jgi:hypothetical protein